MKCESNNEGSDVLEYRAERYRGNASLGESSSLAPYHASVWVYSRKNKKILFLKTEKLTV